jgi:DsbC/DsbD-like thiol-disulfide interchange protein
MRIAQRRLLLLLSVLLVLSAFGHAQVPELGTGAPGPVKARHLAAELISDSGAIAPGNKSRVALALTLEPGWHVYWVYAGDSGEPPSVKWSVPSGFPLDRCNMLRPHDYRLTH